MIRATLLALALVLGGGGAQLGALLDAMSSGWTSTALEAGGHADPDGLAAPTDAGGMADPDGAAVDSDAGNMADPNG